MSYQKLFNNYFSTYGSQTGGAATAGQGAAPKPQLTQEQLNQYLKNQGMDNTPAVKLETPIVPLTPAAVNAKMQEIGWKPTVERKGDKKFDELSRSKITAAGLQVKPKQQAPQQAPQLQQKKRKMKEPSPGIKKKIAVMQQKFPNFKEGGLF